MNMMCSFNHDPPLFLLLMANSERVVLCGSCHFTHDYVKPVGGLMQATVHVCVSVQDSATQWYVTE